MLNRSPLLFSWAWQLALIISTGLKGPTFLSCCPCGLHYSTLVHTECTAHHATCFPTFLSIKRVRQHLPGRCISNKLTEPYRVPKPRILIPDPPPRQKQTRKLKTLLPQSQIHTRKSYFVLWVNNVHSPPVHFVTVLLVWVLMYCETGR